MRGRGCLGQLLLLGTLKILGETEGRRDGDGAGEINDAGRRGWGRQGCFCRAISEREMEHLYDLFLFLVQRGSEVLEWAEFSLLLQILLSIVCGCLYISDAQFSRRRGTSRNSFSLLQIECGGTKKEEERERCECPSILGEGERYDLEEKRDISSDPIRELLGMQKGS